MKRYSRDRHDFILSFPTKYDTQVADSLLAILSDTSPPHVRYFLSSPRYYLLHSISLVAAISGQANQSVDSYGTNQSERTI